MLTILSNIARLNDSTLQSLFHKFWATPILMYVSSVYAFCLVAICVCMYFNRRDNLIYKVLNLAVLSVFVVALWSYLTDVTFIYVVYILTFVSAVVMLFLSVVLMLPSSAVAVPKKAGGYFVFALFTDASSAFYGFSLIVALAAGYGLLAFYTRTKEPSTGVILGLDMSDLSGERLANAKNLVENFTYSATAEQNSTISITSEHLDYLDRRVLLEGYSGPYPVYLAASAKILPKRLFFQNGYVQVLLQPIYELITRIMGTHLAKNILPRRLYENHNVKLFNNIAQRGAEVHLGGDREKKVILVLNRPWWSPFTVFPKARHYIRTAIKAAHFNVSVDSGYRGILNFVLVAPLKRLASAPTKFLNALLIGVNGAFVSARSFISRQELNISSMAIETAVQTAAAWSIFLVALPVSQFQAYRHNFSAAVANFSGASSGLENLANIQYELYVGSPLLMLVCVVGLLVALIGAALLVSTKVLNSK